MSKVAQQIIDGVIEQYKQNVQTPASLITKPVKTNYGIYRKTPTVPMLGGVNLGAANFGTQPITGNGQEQGGVRPVRPPFADENSLS